MRCLFFFITTLLLMGCSSGKQTTAHKAQGEQTFIEFIHKLKKDNNIHPDAVVVINGKAVKESELKKLTITSADIIKLSVSAEKSDDLIPFFGEKSKHGIILITTNENLSQEFN